LDQLGIYHPRQIEFARLNLTHTVLSKRRLLQLVNEGHVSGWDDPRMPTVSGLRRRGYTPEAIRDFSDRIGVAKKDSTVDIALLEHCLREDLNRRASRVMAVLRPLKLTLLNYPQGEVEQIEAINNPEDPEAGTRQLPFSRELYVEADDFREAPPKKWFRLAPGREVRLKHAYLVRCETVIKDRQSGQVVELRCSYDPRSGGGEAPDGRKVRGTLHWVSAAHALPAVVHLYDHLFVAEDPDAGGDALSNLNPRSRETLAGCRVEPTLQGAAPGSRFQFLRHGYFCVDPDSTPERLVFNRAVSLKDSWAKLEKKEQSG
jgi:glutaminyl-tRNA synthetase